MRRDQLLRTGKKKTTSSPTGLEFQNYLVSKNPNFNDISRSPFPSNIQMLNRLMEISMVLTQPPMQSNTIRSFNCNAQNLVSSLVVENRIG